MITNIYFLWSGVEKTLRSDGHNYPSCCNNESKIETVHRDIQELKNGLGTTLVPNHAFKIGYLKLDLYDKNNLQIN